MWFDRKLEGDEALSYSGIRRNCSLLRERSAQRLSDGRLLEDSGQQQGQRAQTRMSKRGGERREVGKRSEMIRS